MIGEQKHGSLSTSPDGVMYSSSIDVSGVGSIGVTTKFLSGDDGKVEESAIALVVVVAVVAVEEGMALSFKIPSISLSPTSGTTLEVEVFPAMIVSSNPPNGSVNIPSISLSPAILLPLPSSDEMSFKSGSGAIPSMLAAVAEVVESAIIAVLLDVVGVMYGRLDRFRR